MALPPTPRLSWLMQVTIYRMCSALYSPGALPFCRVKRPANATLMDCAVLPFWLRWLMPRCFLLPAVRLPGSRSPLLATSRHIRPDPHSGRNRGCYRQRFIRVAILEGKQGRSEYPGCVLHMAADAAVSAGVVVSGIAIILTDWFWLDPVISLIIIIVVIYSTWGLFRDSVQLILSAVPAHIDIAAIDAYLRCQPGVTDVHDLHVWGLSTTESALTVHLVMPEGYPGDIFMDEIRNTLEIRYAIHHSTLQISRELRNHTLPYKIILSRVRPFQHSL